MICRFSAIVLATLIWTGTVQTRASATGPGTVKESFADPDNGPWSYALNWGDGNSTAGNVSIAGKIFRISPHVYTCSDIFSANLSVTDAEGTTGTSGTIAIKVRRTFALIKRTQTNGVRIRATSNWGYSGYSNIATTTTP